MEMGETHVVGGDGAVGETVSQQVGRQRRTHSLGGVVAICIIM